MKRLILIATLLGCGSDDAGLHDVESCGAGQCEHACVGQATEDFGRSCVAKDKDDEPIACGPPVRIVDGVEGCCYADTVDGVSRFAECDD